MAIIPAVVSDTARNIWPQMFGGLLTFQQVSYFKYGEGGWVDPGTGKEPRTPDATLTDLDAIDNPSRYPASSQGTFQKSFDPSDLTLEGTTALKCRCFLDYSEFNDDGNGNAPELWEVGVFDANDNMVAYGTFPIQIKNSGVQIENFVRIIF